MRILVIGSGVAGSVLADMLQEMGHSILVVEREDRPGGMCKSYYKEGFVYEYGPHILAVHNCSEKSANYIRGKIDSIETQMVSASCVQGTLTYYPPSIQSAERLGFGEQVAREIAALPTQPNEANFETYLIDKVGPTLYEKFFKNFTEKFWGIPPNSLSAEWAKTRRLGESLSSKKMFFNDKWCAYPKKDWNALFSSLLRNVNTIYDVDVSEVDLVNSCVKTASGESMKFDLVISTMHIDELFGFRFGRLSYAGYRIEPKVLDRKAFAEIDGNPVSMTYYPDKDIPYCRVSDYGTFQRKTEFPYDRRTIVTYEYPDHSKRLYPFTDSKNLSLFDKYLQESARHGNLLTFGRMGLYKYLTTDTTVEMAFRALEFLPSWASMTSEARFDAYKRIRGDWSN